MRIIFKTMIAAGVLCVFCLGQDASPVPPAPASSRNDPSTTSTQPARIAAGSVIPVQLTKSVDAKKAKMGDEVDVRVTQDMKAQSGQVLMPKDTRIVGHVTEVQGRTKEQKESQLGITFDHAVLKEGGDVPLPASIQAVIAPPSQNPDNSGSGAAPSQAPSGGNSSAAGGSRPAMSGGGGSSPQAPASYPTGGDQSGGAANTPNSPITSSTQGVIGISNYKLSTPGDVTQGSSSRGSVVSSEKSNVKLESGTLMLLRVNQ